MQLVGLGQVVGSNSNNLSNPQMERFSPSPESSAVSADWLEIAKEQKKKKREYSRQIKIWKVNLDI